MKVNASLSHVSQTAHDGPGTMFYTEINYKQKLEKIHRGIQQNNNNNNGQIQLALNRCITASDRQRLAGSVRGRKETQGDQLRGSNETYKYSYYKGFQKLKIE